MPAQTIEVTRPAAATGETAEADPWRADRMICVGLALLTLLVFKQTLGFDFVNFDDDVFVYANSDVANGLSLHGVATALTQGSHANWDPLTTISHMLDCQWFGLRAGGHHLINVLLHTASVLLLFLVLRKMTGARWPSAFAAALFAIHPLRAESVAWVAERKDVLSGLFFMLTLGAYVRYARRPQRLANYFLVVVCFALGLMSKAMLVSLPLVLLLLDYWPLHRFAEAKGDARALRRLFLEKLPLLALSAAAAAAAVLAQSQVHAVQALEQFPAGLRLANALNSVVMYLVQMIYPAGLAVYYPYPKHGLAYGRIGLALVVIAALTTAAWRWRRDRPYFLTGWMWNLLMLAPVLGLVQIGQQARADRYTYLPQIGLAVALSWLAANALSGWRRRQVILAVAGSLAIGVLSLCALKQTSSWRNSDALWEHCLSVTPENALANYNYGLALLDDGRPEAAVPQFARAVELEPGNPAMRGNLGSALFQTGHLEEAGSQLSRAIELDPANPSFHVNLGNARFQQKQVDNAILEYEQALKLDPGYAEAEHTLGYVLLQTGRTVEALVHLAKAVQLSPRDVGARHTLATALLKQGRQDEAIAQFQTALRLQPGFVPGQTSLDEIAWRLATSPDAAARDGREALVLAGGLVQITKGAKPVFLRTLAAALAETGEFAQATATAEQALSVAGRTGDQALAAQLQDQLARYRAGEPLRDGNLTQPASGH